MFGGKLDYFDASSVELMGFWVARGEYQKNFKMQPLTGKVLPDFRDKALMELIQKKDSYQTFLCYNPKTDTWHLSFSFKTRGLSAL